MRILPTHRRLHALQFLPDSPNSESHASDGSGNLQMRKELKAAVFKEKIEKASR
jgi:hypothetical protein